MGETETQSQREPASGLLGWIRRTPPLVLPMVVLSAGLVVAGAVAVKGVRTAADTITVTGASTERIRSDFADWTVVVLGSGTSQQAAYQDLQPDLQRTLAFLRTQGVPDGSVQLAVLESSSNDIRNRVNGALIKTEWSARQPIRISTPDVNLVSKVSRSIGSLVGDGVSLTIQPPAYTYTKLADKRVDMLAKATADARKRAVAIARQAGSGIGAITKADTGTFQITVPNSTDMGRYGAYDTRTIDKDITAVMGVTFRVQ
ncbi:SIMPL domain-containing protein [Synechococcus sp. W2B2]|uniref:SIMPL domain-containing protein n=1 Tax=unclassified Synechococcus TaxID=2626047 RepID=UPI00006ADB1F|nr:probable periplasmic protein [Synechococcus sp. WH 7805]